MIEFLVRNGVLSALVFDAFDFLWTDPLAPARRVQPGRCEGTVRTGC